ncbi:MULTISPECIES: cytochrome C oxidase subunit IV family protein [unclassified Pannonibacter]|uniref:cytochrome C oxidase subunit IV family protein n=1 Tax=unclassified Pannonibacter TaxID=2627228 RepID=UPI001648DCAB|nr:MULTISPECIES: cytochrome C oxidase subunit IV family protein [unclassified Pannonibacter]
MRALHISAAALLVLTALSLPASALPASLAPLLFALTFVKVMTVLLVFAELRHAGRGWQVGLGGGFALLLCLLLALHVMAGHGL